MAKISLIVCIFLNLSACGPIMRDLPPRHILPGPPVVMERGMNPIETETIYTDMVPGDLRKMANLYARAMKVIASDHPKDDRMETMAATSETIADYLNKWRAE